MDKVYMFEKLTLANFQQAMNNGRNIKFGLKADPTPRRWLGVRGGGCGLLVSIFFEKYDDFPNRSDWTKAFFQTCTFSLSKVSEFPKGRRMLDYGLGFIYLSHLIVILAFAHGCIHGYTHGYTHWCSRCTHGPTWLSLCFPWGWLRRPRPLQ
jgi:hypothetical protein